MGDFGKLIIKIDGDTKALRKELAGLDKVGANSVKALGAAIAGTAALMTGAVTQAAKYETSLAKVSTIADTTKVSMEEIDRAVMDLSNSTGMAAADLNEAVYQAISASVDSGKAVEFVGQSVKLAKGGFTDTTTAVDALTTILNAYGLEAEEAGRVSDVLIQTQNKGKTTVDALASSIGKVIPVAASSNVSVENLGAAYAILTSRGIGTAEATTYMNSMLTELGKSGTKASDILKKKTGKSFQDLMKDGYSLGDVMDMLGIDSKNLMGEVDALAKTMGGDTDKAFAELIKKSPKLKKNLADMFGSVEAGKAALTLANAGSKEFNDRLKDMQNSTGATEEAFKKMDKTTEVTFAKLKTRMQNTLIDIGKSALPAVNELAGAISKAFSSPQIQQGINRLKEGLANFGHMVSNIASAVLPPLVSALSWFISNLGTITQLVLSFAAAWAAVKTVLAIHGMVENLIPLMRALKETIMPDPYLALAAAIAGVVAALVVWSSTSKKATEEEIALQKASEECTTATNELTEAINQQNEAHQRNLDTINQNAAVRLNEIDSAKELADELFNLADANGKVADSDKARAEVIISQLNGSLGTNLEITGNVIKNYQQLPDEIYKVIEAEKALAVVQAYQKIYEESTENLIKQKKNLSQATDTQLKNLELEGQLVEAVKNKVGDSNLTHEQALEIVKKGYTERIENGRVYRESLKEEQEILETVQQGNQAYYDAVMAAENAALENKIACDEYEAAITNNKMGRYEEVTNTARLNIEQQKVLETAGAQEILALLKKNNDDIIKAQELKNQSQSELTKEQWDNTINNCQLYGDELVKKYEKLTGRVLTEEEKKKYGIVTTEEKTWQETNDAASKGGNEAVQTFEQTGSDSTSSLMRGLALAASGVKTEMGRMAEEGESGFEGNINAESLGKNTGAGIAQGISGAVGLVQAAAASLARAAHQAYAKEDNQKSPSKKMRKKGRFTGQGAVLGIKDEIPNAEAAAKKLAFAINSSFDDGVEDLEINIPQDFLDEFFDETHGIQARVQAVFDSMTPRAAMTGGYGGTKVINNTTTTTNAPTMVFNKEVQSPDVVAREVNKIFMFGLAGEH